MGHAYRAVELFSSSTNLNVVLNDSANVINVKHLERWWLCLNFIPFVVYIYISFNIFLSSKSSSTIFVCAIIMTSNFTCSLIDCYLFLYFLSRDIHERFLVNLPQMFLVSCRWVKRGCEYMFVAGNFVIVQYVLSYEPNFYCCWLEFAGCDGLDTNFLPLKKDWCSVVFLCKEQSLYRLRQNVGWHGSTNSTSLLYLDYFVVRCIQENVGFCVWVHWSCCVIGNLFLPKLWA